MVRVPFKIRDDTRNASHTLPQGVDLIHGVYVRPLSKTGGLWFAFRVNLQITHMRIIRSKARIRSNLYSTAMCR